MQFFKKSYQIRDGRRALAHNLIIPFNTEGYFDMFCQLFNNVEEALNDTKYKLE